MIIWIGIAAIAIGVLAWAGTYIAGIEKAAPPAATITAPPGP
ncbi:MAG TPA: hypothetical protein VGJ28_11965 [Micromonosporaceae bacterium]